MIVGLLRDIKIGENRTIITPLEAEVIIDNGHTVLVQKGAGKRAGFKDEYYSEKGCEIVDTMQEIYARADFVTKVKELEEVEYNLLRENQIIFTCIHPAAHREELQAILDSKCIAFTAEDSHRYGSPNCEAAGKQGALMGLQAMLSINGGKGKYVGGLAGAPGINVIILGAGLVGKSALQVLHALGARCTVMDVNIGVLRNILFEYGDSVHTMLSNKQNIKSILKETDMIVNCVKWPKGRNDYLVDLEMLDMMEDGSVIVDISNDENGALEAYRETTHENPYYIERGVVHYGVSNIPGSIARSTSISYAASVLPHFLSILNNGIEEACTRDGYLRRSLTAYKGYLTHEESSSVQDRAWIDPIDVLKLDRNICEVVPNATTSKSDNKIILENWWGELWMKQ